MFRKFYSALAALAVLALLGSACGSGATPSPAATQAVTVTLTDSESQELFVGLSQMKGHLYSSIGLYRTGDLSTSAVHAIHPVDEVFKGISLLLTKKTGQADALKGALDAYAAALNNNAASDAVEQAHANALAVIEDSIQTMVLPGHEKTVEFLAPVMVDLLNIAVSEYEESIKDGQIVEMIEYQDSNGFVRVTREVYGLMKADLTSRNASVAERVEGYLNQDLAGVFPSLTPPTNPLPAEAIQSAVHEITLALSEVVPDIVERPKPVPSASASAAAASTLVIPEGALVIYSGRNEPLIKPVMEAFKAAYPGIEVVAKSGSNGALANELLEEQANPQADLFITTETFTVKALQAEGVFENYISPKAADISTNYKDPAGAWTGVTLRARVIMYNTDLVSAEEAPQSVFDLTDPKWAGQIAAASSTNGSLQAQVAVMQHLLGDDITEGWLQGLLDNEVTFLGSHTDVRTAVGSGEFKLGLVNSYYYYLQKAEGSPVGLVIPDQGADQIGVVVNASAVAIVKGGKNTEAAKAFVDFLLSPEGQELFAKLNYEYPIISGVPTHAEVEPLVDYKIADANLADEAIDLNKALDLLERVGVP